MVISMGVGMIDWSTTVSAARVVSAVVATTGGGMVMDLGMGGWDSWLSLIHI